MAVIGAVAGAEPLFPEPEKGALLEGAKGEDGKGRRSLVTRMFVRAGQEPRGPVKVVVPRQPGVAPAGPPPVTRGRTVSIVRAFSGATVLITGATGYIGSLVMEQLLREIPDLKRIYVLVRDKKGCPAHKRMDKLLSRPFFHLLRGKDGQILPEVRAKIRVVHGDMLQPLCGVSPEDRQRLGREVDFVVHSAASIAFNDHIHRLISQNWQATKSIGDLAATFSRVRAFVHVSTAYTNSDRPYGSLVDERVFPLCLDRGQGKALDPEEVAAELAALPHDAAEERAQEYLRDVGLANNYFFTKRLSELTIQGYHNRPFPVAIVRPSLVGCVARLPYPGYFGNSAGPTAIAMAFAIGISTFTCHRERSVFDVIPGDLCSSVILASAAAAKQRLAGAEEGPLVVHACSSTTNPENLYGWWAMAYQYWSADPAPLRLGWGGYPSMRAWQAPVGMNEHGWLFRCRTVLAELKFRFLAFLLWLLGYPAYAAKIMNGWVAWKLYNTRQLDFNLFFDASASKELEAALEPSEAKRFQLVWRAGKDDWGPYLRCHFDQIRVFFFKQHKYRNPALPAV